MTSLSAPLGRQKRARRFPVGLLLVAAPVILVVALVIYPILSSLSTTLNVDVAGAGRFSLANYARFFSDDQSLRNLRFTAWFTTTTVALLFLVCLPLALYLRFSFGRLPAFVQAIATFPLFVPGIIVAYALIRFIGPNGTLQSLLDAAGLHGYRTPYLTTWGPVIGLLWEGIPLTLLVLVSGLSQVPQAAIDAARDVGAGPLRILVFIILPLIRNSIIVALSLEFLRIFGAFTQPYLLGPASPESMGVYMQRTFGDLQDPVQAATQAMITFLCCSVAGVIYVRTIIANRRAGR
ncbi:ABC transporter permease subunit [Kaistia dalseonensis]|uniref:ABC-type spermidine/putrescine transport system permease subunit I n=1 Tax=Kaistia dalseonensis TaxID=410840 RepID=A0ABU0HAM1_9HYPH|nr:ABC transporter permease subunit [Kaistia dalseonensis]MCX5496732.1 ABC transporter permease subunit [Kaistia dalseonensis]MDQ0439358.1 ABC-type spermidine/putrescine transport system permease subunit I [Kaistia dalseonensis]